MKLDSSFALKKGVTIANAKDAQGAQSPISCRFQYRYSFLTAKDFLHLLYWREQFTESNVHSARNVS